MTENKMTLEQLKSLYTVDGQQLPWIQNISVVPNLALTKPEIESALEILNSEEETGDSAEDDYKMVFKVLLQYTAWADFLVGKIQNGEGVGEFLDSYTNNGLRHLVDTYNPFSKNKDIEKRKEFTGKVCDFLTEKYWS